MEAVVLYDYAAQEPDELTLKKGDVITKIQTMDGGWWEGTLSKDEKRGLFPDNFVKIISTNINSNSSEPTLTGRKFRVKYNYTPVNADELELNINDVIELISEIEEGWWEGKLKNKIGVFPSNFVTEITETEDTVESNCRGGGSASNNLPSIDDAMDVDEPKTNSSSDVPELPPKPKPVKEMCIALFPYEAKHEDELSLKENDMILLLSTELPDKGWWKGQLNGKIGVFPDNFVKVIPIEEDVAIPKRPTVVKTTNKLRDNINKQSNSTVAALRKSIETAVKPDEIPAARKPVVMKKPSFVATSASDGSLKSYLNPGQVEKMSPSPERALNTFGGGGSNTDVFAAVRTEPDRKSWTETSPDTRKSRPLSASALTDKLNAELQESFSMKEIDNTDGVTASKIHKVINNHAESRVTGMQVDENVEDREIDLNVVERSELLTHPTASRVKAPKRRPPSGINFKEEEIGLFNGKGSPSKVMINGTADLGHDKTKAAPWLQELKMSQVKKSSSQVNIKSGFTSSGSNVTFRFQRPVSMFSGETESPSFSFQTKSTPPSSEAIINTTSTTAIATNTTTTTTTTNNNNNTTSTTTSIVVSPDKTVTIAASDWIALNDRISNLEMRLETQNECFKKTTEQLKLALVKEIELRLEMKKEMDKLMELVTQV